MIPLPSDDHHEPEPRIGTLCVIPEAASSPIPLGIMDSCNRQEPSQNQSGAVPYNLKPHSAFRPLNLPRPAGFPKFQPPIHATTPLRHP